MRQWSHGYIEYALDFAGAGLYDEAIASCCKNVYKDELRFIRWCTIHWVISNRMKGNQKKAIEWYKKAAKLSPEKCFPNQN